MIYDIINSMAFEKLTLANKLPILLVPMPGSEVTAILFLVRAGSRTETKETNGLARLYANMCLKKTKSYFDRLALSAAIDRIGAVFNLEIHKEYTAFYIKVLNRNFDQGLSLLSEVITAPSFDVNELSREKSYFQAEIANRQANPSSRAIDELNKIIFAHHPLSHSGIGDKEVIEKIKLNDLVVFGKKRYQAGNSLLVVCGQTKDIKEKLEKTFGGFPQGERFNFDLVDQKWQSQTKVIELEIPQSYFAIGFPAFPRTSQQRFEQILLDVILGKMKSNTRLANIYSEEALAQYIRTGASMFKEVGLFTIQMISTRQKAKKAYQRIIEELEKIKQTPVSAEELTKAKGYYQGTLAMSITEPVEKAFFYGLQDLLDQQILTEKEFFSKVERTTPEKIKTVANQIFDFQRMGVVMVGKES